MSNGLWEPKGLPCNTLEESGSRRAARSRMRSLWPSHLQHEGAGRPSPGTGLICELQHCGSCLRTGLWRLPEEGKHSDQWHLPSDLSLERQNACHGLPPSTDQPKLSSISRTPRPGGHAVLRWPPCTTPSLYSKLPSVAPPAPLLPISDPPLKAFPSLLQLLPFPFHPDSVSTLPLQSQRSHSILLPWAGAGILPLRIRQGPVTGCHSTCVSFWAELGALGCLITYTHEYTLTVEKLKIIPSTKKRKAIHTSINRVVFNLK